MKLKRDKCLNKGPTKEQELLVDQRRARKMFIGGVDIVTSRSLRRRVARINRKEEIKSKAYSKVTLDSANVNDPDEKSSSSDSELGDEFLPTTSMQPPIKALDAPSTSQMRINIKKLALVCDRTGVSDRAAAMLASAVLHDVGIITKDDKSQVIDRSKIRRARKNVRNAIQHNAIEMSKINVDSVVVIGCDGTVVNTGRKNRVIVQLERKLGRPLQWFICMLHINEFPLRHLLHFLDGSTTGPRGFSLEIEKQLETCEKLPVVRFQPIEVEQPDVDVAVLSTDQKYLYEACNAISSGNFSFDLCQRNPGPLAHSRWLTCANRILRLYAATEVPSTNLKILSSFVIKVYAPTWFHIKMRPSCLEGPKHLQNMIHRSRFLSRNILEIIDPNCELSEPPILASIPNDHLNQPIKTVPEMDLVRFPSHTQVVESMMIVSEASLVVSGAESRDGYVHTMKV
nr:unnamed protein product [Callosobruchus analis]